jgi:hypothetical protein
MSTPDALHLRELAEEGAALNSEEQPEREVCDGLLWALAEIERLRGIVPEVLERLNDELCAENERLRADAARYRWLRDEEGALSSFTAAYFNTQTADQLDSAIDAAMRDATKV